MGATDGDIGGDLRGCGNGQLGQTGVELLFDPLRGAAAEAFELIDHFEFAIKSLDAQAFAIEGDQVVLGRQFSIYQRGEQDHFLTALMLARTAAGKAAREQADGHGQRLFIMTRAARQD